ncbi:MAG: hypothetical protein M3Q07_26525 [Pseudobdellovibrionaceae bacterium]|nr:hypothetical protein [Pseudobdellovibrionaceae bacterium]
MSSDILQEKRNQATGLGGGGLKVKPLAEEGENKASPAEGPSVSPPPQPIEDDGIARKGAATQATGAVLPIITKPELRPYNVSGRVTKRVHDKLDELAKLTGRTQSYLVSRMLEENADAWVEQQKAFVERERRKK